MLSDGCRVCIRDFEKAARSEILTMTLRPCSSWAAHRNRGIISILSSSAPPHSVAGTLSKGISGFGLRPVEEICFFLFRSLRHGTVAGMPTSYAKFHKLNPVSAALLHFFFPGFTSKLLSKLAGKDSVF